MARGHDRNQKWWEVIVRGTRDQVTAMTDCDPLNIRRILVREVNWVGDAVLTLPALEALQQRSAPGAP